MVALVWLPKVAINKLAFGSLRPLISVLLSAATDGRLLNHP